MDALVGYSRKIGPHLAHIRIKRSQKCATKRWSRDHNIEHVPNPRVGNVDEHKLCQNNRISLALFNHSLVLSHECSILNPHPIAFRASRGKRPFEPPLREEDIYISPI